MVGMVVACKRVHSLSCLYDGECETAYELKDKCTYMVGCSEPLPGLNLPSGNRYRTSLLLRERTCTVFLWLAPIGTANWRTEGILLDPDESCGLSCYVPRQGMPIPDKLQILSYPL